MLKILVDYDELIRITCEQLTILSELKPEFVRNALTEYGASLDQHLGNTIYEAFDKRAVLLFNIKPSDDINLITKSAEDDTILLQIASYTIHLCCYGEFAQMTLRKLIINLHSYEAKLNLYAAGIWFIKNSNLVSIQEYKNNVMYDRYDVDLTIACIYKFIMTFPDNYADNGEISVFNISLLESL